MTSRFNFLATVLLAVTGFSSGTHAYGQDTKALCGEMPDTPTTDYRDRSTAQLRWNIDDNKRNHLDPASRRMQTGDYSRSVISDLDWTLVRYPNHQLALELLIRYFMGGGRSYEFQSIDCYFQLAKDFAPDDGAVPLAEGYYYWRTNRVQAAIKSYEAAIKLMPGSAAAHYNLGLIYFEQKNYTEAARYASIAYEFGYPLNALREKLAALGYKLASTPAPEHSADE